MSRKLALQQYGNRLVNDLQVYLRSLHTHQANNQIVSRARDALFATLLEHFEKEPQSTIQVQLLPEETFINNTLLPIAMQDFGRIKELTERLRGMGVGELVFNASVTKDGLSTFAKAVYDCMHARQPLDERSFTGIQALELDYSSSGSSERDAHQVVVWLFAGLLDGLDGLKDLVEDDHVPTMVPFMRHTRLLVDLTAERGVVMRHLCLAPVESVEKSDVHRAAARTFLVAQVAHANGLDRATLMALGLASILDLITHGTEPDKVLSKVVPYSTLSDLAPQVMMLLRDLELARRGHRASRKGQLLHLVDELVSVIHRETPPSLDDVQEHLGSVSGVESAVLESVLGWLGDVPIGAVAHSHSMGRVLLFDHVEDGETLRCREIFDDGLGTPQPFIDLDESKPIVFEGRVDFPFEEDDDWD